MTTVMLNVMVIITIMIIDCDQYGGACHKLVTTKQRQELYKNQRPKTIQLHLNGDNIWFGDAPMRTLNLVWT